MKNKPLILILDDLKSELDFIEDVLIRNSFSVTLTNKPEDFFKKLEQIKPNLILLDILMPEIDGYEICKQIKENEKFESIPIVFLTALVKDKDVIKGLEYGAVDFITKPFNEEILLLRVQSVLNQSRQIEKYKFLANNISDVVWRYDLNLKCKYISPSVYNLRGVTVEEAMNSKPEDTFPPDSLSRIKELTRIKLEQIKNNDGEGLKPFILNIELYKKDKSTVWTQISVSVIKESINKEIEIIGVTRDISKQKETELALLESENRYRALFEKSKDPVLFLKDREIIDCNKATLDVLKISSKDKLLKKKPWELSPVLQPDGRRSKEKAIEMIETALNNGHHEYDWVHSDSLGKCTWFHVSLFKVIIKGDTLLYTIWRDISAENSLKKSEAKLKKTNKEKDKFISILAHDLKNSIGGSVSLFKLLESKDTIWEKRDLFITEIGKNIKASNNLLQDLIKWGKATLGKESFGPKELNICEVFKKVQNLYNSQLLQKKIIFKNRCNKYLITWADPDMLDTILRNLVSNAIKYSNKNGTIRIEAVATGKETIIGIIDTGVGMPKEKADNLFNFANMQSELGTEGEKGNGFGLQIAKEYITIHGGKTHVKSKLEEGTTIFFTLPDKK
jgi:PAS domain S-box-containing protein